MSEQNKLVKMATDSAVLVGLSAGVGYLAKKILKENFSRRPVLKRHGNYAKIYWCFSRVSMALKTYLGRSGKILPKIYLKMASIAIMLGGAVLNASTFIGGFLLGKIFIRFKN